MRILLTVHQYFPDYYTGTEAVARHVAAGLRAAGHDVRVFTGYPARRAMADDERFEEYTFESIPVMRFHHVRSPMGACTNIMRGEYSNEFFAAYFRSYVQRFQPDVVHIFHMARLSSSVIDVCRELHIPMVHTVTDFWSVCSTCVLRLPDNRICPGPRRLGANCVKHLLTNAEVPPAFRLLAHFPDWLVGLAVWAVNHKLLLRNSIHGQHVQALSQRRDWLVARLNQVDRLLVLTHTLRGVFIRHGVHPRRITVLPHGMETAHISRTDQRGRGGALRVGFLGQIAEHKGCHILIQAVQSLAADAKVELLFHGNRDENPEYRDRLLALAHNDPRIEFRGPYDHAQIDAVLRNLDVVVVPSIWYENTPLVIYEACAAGCPVIASNLGGMAEMVRHNQDGLLFKMGSVPALAQALDLLARDRTVLRRLAEGVRPPKRIAEYVAELEGIYGELCGGKTR